MVFSIFFKLNCLIYFCNVHAAGVSFSRIVNGFVNDISNVPYIVQFQLGYSVICGGSIISPTHVLTAAHCLDPRSNKPHDPRELSVLTGSSKLGIGKRYKITWYKCHPKYSKLTIDYDVCILKTKENIRLNNNCKIINLASRPIEKLEGSRALVSGYGRTSYKGRMSKMLRSVRVSILPRRYCQMSYFGLTRRMFCAGFRSGRYDSCIGDSGGPLELNGELFGIVSFGRVCAAPGSPGVYSNVYRLKDWIKSEMK